MNKNIKGVVKSFSKIEVGTKQDGKTFAFIDMHLIDEKYPSRLFFDTANEIKEKVIDRVPIGSTVEFTLVKTGNYWNIDKKSFEVVVEGDGSVPKSYKPSTDTDNIYIIRQNALRHADAKRANTKMPDKEYFEFAEKCVKWILGDLNE